MAVIGKIRNNSGLVLLVIGGAMVAFILGDLFSNRGGGYQDQEIGNVAGEPLSLQEFEGRIKTEADAYRNEFGQNVDGAQMEQLRTQVWNEMVRERVLLTQAREAGLSVVKDEYDDVRFGNNIMSSFTNNPNFKNPETGQVDKSTLINYFNGIQQNAPIYHSIQKRRIRADRLADKYYNLIKGSLYVNTAEASGDVTARSAQVNFDFVLKEYSTEPDSLFTPTEEELNRYYSEHKNEVRYNQKAARSFEYVKFPVDPTPEDVKDTQAYLEDLKEEFQETTEDSSFVANTSDTRTYNPAPFSEGSLDVLTDSLLANADTGAVIGPYKDGDAYKLSKVVEIQDLKEARVRHILLKTGTSDDAAVELRADSILRAVKRNNSVFEDMVTKYSEDPGSVSNGGVYEWFDEKRMVPEFTEASFEQPVGAITKCKTTYGFHIVEVLDQRTTNQRMIATIVRNIRPSGATFATVYKIANQFSLNQASPDSFRIVAEEKGATWQEVDELRPDQNFVPGLQDAGSVISAVYRMEEVGTLSEPVEIGENYVVARLTSIREAGVPRLDDIRDEVISEVIKEKKAAKFVGMMKGKTDLPSLASEVGSTVRSANAVNMGSATITGGFAEKAVIGKIFAMKEGDTTVDPLVGEQGVYVVKLTSRAAADPQEDYTVDKENLMTRISGSAQNAAFNALREAAGVEDDRKRYY
jgi:peptidyl-prolyl cis-trans isomerase D